MMQDEGAESSSRFGQDVIPLNKTEGGLFFKFRKAPEKYTNIKLVNPEGSSFDCFSDDAMKSLSELRELRALSIGHLNGKNKRDIYDVFRGMPHLRCLILEDVFSETFSDFNRHGLTLCPNLEELEIFSHQFADYRGDFWEAFGEASNIVKLKRFSFVGAKLSKNGFRLPDFMGALSKFKTLQSCKMVFDELMSYYHSGSDLILDYLRNNQQLRVLEIGVVDLNHPTDREFVESVLKVSGGLQSFGLKLAHWNVDSAKYLSELLNRNPGNVSQLILNVDTVNDFNFIDLAKDLLKTNILDIRIVQNNVEVTPSNLIEFFQKKIVLLVSMLVSSSAKEESYDLAGGLGGLAALHSKLIQDMSSVAILDLQLIEALVICLELGLNAKESLENSDKYFEKLFAWIEVGKVSRSFILSFIRTIPARTFNNYLRLLQLCLSEYSQEDIESVIKPSFSRMIFDRLGVFNEQFEPHFFSKIEKSNDNVDHKALEVLLSDLSGYVDVFDGPRFRDLMSPTDRDCCKITVSLLKDKIFYCLGREEHFVKECILSQMKDYIESSDLDFAQWCTKVVACFNAEGHYNNDRSPSILRMLLAQIKSPQKLVLMVKVIVNVNIPHMGLPKEQYILLVQSLAVLRMAMRRGYEDNDEIFQQLFNQLVEKKEAVLYGQSKDEIRSAALKEIDVMMDALFQSEVKVDSVKTSLKDLIKKDDVKGERVPLRDLLRPKKGEETLGEKPVPLKELLRSKKGSDSSLGIFFDKQPRESGDESGADDSSTP